MLSKLSAFFRLTRIEHAFMFAFAVLMGELIVGLPQLPTLLLSLLIPIFSEMGAFALNDYLDFESDRINKKMERPLVSGEINREFAILFSFFSITLALIFSYFLNTIIFYLTFFLNLLAILYNYYLKKLPFIGNLYIAFTMAIPFIFGNLVVTSELHGLNIILALMGLASGLGREIFKTIEDVEGDRKGRNAFTLAVWLGEKTSSFLGIFFYQLFLLITILPYWFYLPLGIGTLLVFFADCLVLISLKEAVFDRNYAKSRKSSLGALALGMFGIFLSIIGF